MLAVRLSRLFSAWQSWSEERKIKEPQTNPRVLSLVSLWLSAYSKSRRTGLPRAFARNRTHPRYKRYFATCNEALQLQVKSKVFSALLQTTGKRVYLARRREAKLMLKTFHVLGAYKLARVHVKA